MIRPADHPVRLPLDVSLRAPQTSKRLIVKSSSAWWRCWLLLAVFLCSATAQGEVAPRPAGPPAPPPPPVGIERDKLQAKFEAEFKPFLPDAGAIRAATLMRLSPDLADPSTGLLGFPILAQQFLGSEDLEAVLAIFRDASNFSFEGFGCFVPHHGLRLESETGRIDLVICLQCANLLLEHSGGRDARALSANGVAVLDLWLRQLDPAL